MPKRICGSAFHRLLQSLQRIVEFAILNGNWPFEMSASASARRLRQDFLSYSFCFSELAAHDQ